jgi:hypothetical protein
VLRDGAGMRLILGQVGLVEFFERTRRVLCDHLLAVVDLVRHRYLARTVVDHRNISCVRSHRCGRLYRGVLLSSV